MPRLVQITDCHLVADSTASPGPALRQLKAVVEAVNRECPDLVLVTGDITHDETLASYQLAVAALDALDAPWAWLAGNHDDPELMVENRELREEIGLDGWRILLLDTRVEGQSHGELGPGKLGQLAERLERDERPTLLAMHHPPLPVGSAWMDAIGLVDRDAFWQTLSPFGQVRGVLCGHIHQAFAARRPIAAGDVMVYGCPATSNQFLPDSEHFAIDEVSSPGYRVVELSEEGVEARVERLC